MQILSDSQLQNTHDDNEFDTWKNSYCDLLIDKWFIFHIKLMFPSENTLFIFMYDRDTVVIIVLHPDIPRYICLRCVHTSWINPIILDTALLLLYC